MDENRTHILTSETKNEAVDNMDEDIKVKIIKKNRVWDYDWLSYDTRQCPVVCYYEYIKQPLYFIREVHFLTC